MYEWDKAKREANLKKHGLDFFVAHTVFESLDKLTVRIRIQPEERFLDVALIKSRGSILALVYTIRNGNVRFICFRHASRKERKAYAAARS